MRTAENMVYEAIAVLQRGLPSGDLTDRDVIAELWGIFDNPAAREILKRARERAPANGVGSTR